MADEEGFVGRWSRRKAEARLGTARSEPAPPVASASDAPEPPPATRPPEPAEAVIDVASLPDIESLTFESDFTVFLRPGVPAELRRRALRRLWRSDPVLANLDGLIDYAEDYHQAGAGAQIVRTAYRVGRGMVERIEAAAGAAPVEPPTSPRPLEPPARDGDPAGDRPPVIEAGAGEAAAVGGVVDDPRPAPERSPLKGP